MKRRSFLKFGMGACALFGARIAGASTETGSSTFADPKSVILMVSDGMSFGTLCAADQFRRWRDGRPSNWMRLLEEKRGCRAAMDMASADSPVTDSAAAASSWSGGTRVNNGSLNVDPEGREHPPIADAAREAGKAVGLVTTTQLTHATPAGMAAVVPRRSMQNEIAGQYFERRIDVLLGGGIEHFDPGRRPDQRNLLGEFESAGYATARNAQEMRAGAGKSDRLIGVFSEEHLPFEIDRMNRDDLKSSVPSLSEMTSIALDVLDRRNTGFFLLLEGGRVDHAAHANDLGGLIHDQLAFDDAVATALEFIEKRPNTLLIITTDHGNANPGFLAQGEKAEAAAERFSGFKGSFESIWPKLTVESTPAEIREVLGNVLGLPFNESQAGLLRDALRGQYKAPFYQMNPASSLLGQLVANHTEFGWIGNDHTSDYVELWATGPGSESIGYLLRNTDLHRIMANALSGSEA